MSESNALRSPQARNGTMTRFIPVRALKSPEGVCVCVVCVCVRVRMCVWLCVCTCIGKRDLSLAYTMVPNTT